jgi:hypothetical protein
MLKFAITLIAALFVSAQSFALDVALPPDTTTTLVDKTSAMLLIEEGRSLYNEGKVRDALVRFRQSAVKDPMNWRSAYWVSQCHYSMNNYGLALKYATEAVGLDKNEVDKDVYELLGRSYHRMGNIDSALTNYKTAMTMLSASRVKELQLELRVRQCEFAKTQIASGKRSQKVSIGSANSGYNDYCPILTDGGKALYFTSRRSDTKGGSMNPDDQEFFEDTYFAVWNSEINDWDSISNELGRVNSDGFDAINFISRDGLHGLMTINTTATDAKKPTKGSDIFTIELSTKNKWSTPKRINNKTINTGFFEGSATMTEDGNTMYFVSDRKGDKSSTDIYVVQKNGKAWGEAQPLPFTINTTGRETTPFITGDGRYLFYSSDGLEGMGGLDVYVAENKGDSWSTPVNLGIMVNSVNNDTHFQYYQDMKKAVMSSFEIVGQKASMDLYQIDMSSFVFPAGK